MMYRTFVAAVAAAVLAAVTANCGGQTTTTGPTLTATLLRIDGPTAIAPGQTVSFRATATMSNGTTEDYTRKVGWSALPISVMTIADVSGQAIAQSAGDVTIAASNSCCHAQTTRTVLPPNTYRLTGKVLESGLPVAGAAIAVLSGIGVGLSATTDGSGTYRLYGVGGPIQIKFSKAGYEDSVQTFNAMQNDVLDFPDVHQAAPLPALAGTYTLTLTADPSCPTASVGGIATLPDNFRSPRSYAAALTQSGALLTVTLTDPSIVPHRNQFTGHAEPDAIEFTIGYYGSSGLVLYNGVAEQVSSNQMFDFGGQVRAQRTGRALNGHLAGVLELYTQLPANGNPYTLTALCTASNHQVTLTPAAQPSHR